MITGIRNAPVDSSLNESAAAAVVADILVHLADCTAAIVAAGIVELAADTVADIAAAYIAVAACRAYTAVPDQ